MPVIQSDCIKWMQGQAPNTIDAVVTDPPYGLEFMAAEWDTFQVRLPREVLNKRRTAHLATVEQLRRHDVTNKAQLELLVYQEWTRQWALEAYRILKPGAYMLVMSGTRTYHRMVSGLEDAGFLIRDCLCWVYASGFPKSYDISRGFDKRAGVEREVVGTSPTDRPHSQVKSGKSFDRAFDKGQGHEPILITEPSTDLAQQWQGWGTALKPAWEPIVMVQKPLEGTYCQNVERWGVGGLNIDECRVETVEDEPNARKSKAKDHITEGVTYQHRGAGEWTGERGRFPANVQVDSEPDGLLDDGREHKGQTAKQKKHYEAHQPINMGGGEINTSYGDTGGFSRFFIIPKASKAERNQGLEEFEKKDKPTLGKYTRPSEGRTASKSGAPSQNYHPTVKPIRLMKQMIKLVTPPSGTVLDPFLGSGTACLAALELGINCIGLEQSEEYCNIARQRIDKGGTINDN